MARKTYDDTAEEKALFAAYERGEFVPVKNQKKEKALAEKSAQNYIRKEARINIRLSAADLLMLKQRAAVEGLPYQTLIASVLHKYASGTLHVSS